MVREVKILHLKFRRTPGDTGPAHAQVQMFSALVEDDVTDPTVGLCGEVTMRMDEWIELQTILKLDQVKDLHISLARP